MVHLFVYAEGKWFSSQKISTLFHEHLDSGKDFHLGMYDVFVIGKDHNAAENIVTLWHLCNVLRNNATGHLESCTPGQDWAKWYVLVCTSTYQYKTVQVSTRIPNLYIPVCTSTYRR